MSVGKVASVLAVLGGLAWVVTGVLAGGDGEADPSGAAAGTYWVGMALLVVALLLAGYSLVATAPIWLRGVVSVATAALGAMVWTLVVDALSTTSVQMYVGGGVALLAGVAGLLRKRPARPERPVHGRRAAR